MKIKGSRIGRADLSFPTVLILVYLSLHSILTSLLTFDNHHLVNDYFLQSSTFIRLWTEWRKLTGVKTGKRSSVCSLAAGFKSPHIANSPPVSVPRRKELDQLTPPKQRGADSGSVT